jgi:hypothetical protein
MTSFASPVPQTQAAESRSAVASASHPARASNLIRLSGVVRQDGGISTPSTNEAEFSYSTFVSTLQLSGALQVTITQMSQSRNDAREFSPVGNDAALDAATMEAVRREVRAGVAEALDPMRQLATALAKTMTKATETAALLQKTRVR